MKYIIMCGGNYDNVTTKLLTKINGEYPVARTIRLLKEAGQEDICISSNLDIFEQFGVPVLHHDNRFTVVNGDVKEGYWVDAFYPTDEPTCYMFGDVFYSKRAMQTIIDTDTDSIEFFASAPPFDKRYTKKWAEPFAFKVVDTKKFKRDIKRVKDLCDAKAFKRHPIAWELWQVIKHTDLNNICYNNYVKINDYTRDVDCQMEVEQFERLIKYGLIVEE